MFSTECVRVISAIILLALKTECSTDLFINDSLLVEDKEFNITCTSSESSRYSRWYAGNRTFIVSVPVTVGNCIAQGANQSVLRCNHPDDRTYIVTVVPRIYQNGEKWVCEINFINSTPSFLNITVPVANVTITPGSDYEIVLKENVNTEVTCVTSYSRPRANITWYIHSKSVSIPINGSVCSHDTNNEELVSTECAIQLNLTRNYNDGYLVYTAENINNYKVVSGNKTLNITYVTNQPLIHCTKNGIYKVVNNTQGKLTCSVDGGNPAGTLHWNCTGKVTEHHGPKNNVTQTLVWNALQTKYCACIAKNYAGTRSTSVISEVFYVPVIDELQDKFVFEGEHITVNCVILRANPPVSEISWTSNGHNISGSSLFIPNVSRTDDGTYTCTANSIMDPSCKEVVQGSTSRSLHIGVLYPPLVNIPHGTRFTVTEGDMFNYTCPIEPGNPSVTSIMWTRSTDSSTWRCTELLIHNVTRYEDSVYTCYASNEMVNSNGITRIGNVSADIRLIVLFKTNVTDFFLRGHWHDIIVTVLENASLVFECYLQSNPTSHVRIYEAETLVNGSRANHMLYHTNAICSGGPVAYSCSGNNSLSNTPFTLKIELVLNCTPRRYMNEDELVATGAINDTVTLSYTALAYPPPSFTWYRNGSTIDTTDSRFIVSSTDFQTYLTIKYVEESDFGEYKLKVANEIGFINESYNLKSQGVPESPTHFRQDNISTTDSKIALYWTSGFNNGLEQTFTILYRKQYAFTWMDVSVPNKGRTGTIQHYNISGLSSDTNYDIVVFGVNAIGPSRANVTLTCRTKESTVKELSDTSKNIPAIIGGTLAVMFVLCGLVVVTFIYRRWFMKDKRPESSTDQPVTYENLKIEQIPNTPLDVQRETSETNVDTCKTYEGLSRQDNEKESEYTQLGNTSNDDAKQTYEHLKIQLSSCQPRSGMTSAI